MDESAGDPDLRRRPRLRRHSEPNNRLEDRSDIPLLKQVWHFIVHLRWHYQLFILSGGFLLGGFFHPTIDWGWFLLQFFNVHLLLFGGATAFNSYWDRDEGPIGGLKHPPRMQPWMWVASMTIQVVGLLIALPAGRYFTGIYALSILLFWLYSTPLARWKGRPILSLVAIGVSTGTNSFLLGYLAAGEAAVGWPEIAAAVGVALVILSLYPTSQIYQTEEDRRRGDRTFAVQYGRDGVFSFFRVAFALGILLISIALGLDQLWLGLGFFAVGGGTGLSVWQLLKGLSGRSEDYDRVMRIKYATSIALVLVLLAGLLVKHLGFGFFS